MCGRILVYKRALSAALESHTFNNLLSFLYPGLANWEYHKRQGTVQICHFYLSSVEQVSRKLESLAHVLSLLSFSPSLSYIE